MDISTLRVIGSALSYHTSYLTFGILCVGIGILVTGKISTCNKVSISIVIHYATASEYYVSINTLRVDGVPLTPYPYASY